MLTAHRDQENVVHSHQLPVKQQKMHGTRYPKTPSRFPQHDENAPTAFTGKTALRGTTKIGGNENILTKGNGMQQALVTPMAEPRSRAPLGNKTTNAKARSGQTGVGKGAAKDFEKTQAKPTRQKPKQKSPEIAPIKFETKIAQKEVDDGDEEPEYAPPKPKELPYESDVFPRGLLSLEGLKNENLFKGYYEHFYNPIDENGVSKQEREFEETMKKVMAKAEAQNQRETGELKWNFADLADTIKPVSRTNGQKQASTVSLAKKAPAKYPGTLASRRAASALAIPPDATKKPLTRPTIHAAKSRKPLASLLHGKRATKDIIPRKTSRVESAVGEAASRTTIGYNKGKSASSMMRSTTLGPGKLVRAERSNKAVGSILSQPDLTVTPGHLRQAALKKQENDACPQFMSIFDGAEDEDEDLPAMIGPLDLSDEEEFEMKFDI